MDDAIGRTYGMWTVIEDAGVRSQHRYYKCRCNTCGNERDIRFYNLMRDKPKCECLYVDAPKHHYATIARGIYDYLDANPDSTMKEVSTGLEKFGYSFAEVRRTMLREKGKKIHVSGHRNDKSTWSVN